MPYCHHWHPGITAGLPRSPCQPFVCLRGALLSLQQVNEQLKVYLSNKIDDITVQTKEWAEKQTDRQRQMEETYQHERKAKELLETRLHDATTQASAEKQKRDLRRELDEKEKQQKKREEDMEIARREAATRLQAAFKAFLIRQVLAQGKKGKKGKKK